MKTKLGNSILGLFLLVAAFSASAAVAELKPVKLPKPVTSGGMPLMEALAKRSTSRSFSGKELSPQMLSNLLWAAFGINRPDGKRTAPSAMNWQEISIYVATKDGVYLYDAAGNVLQPVAEGDQRAKTGMQQQAAQSPVSLIFVADFGKTKQVQKDDKILYTSADTGFISQNVYLFCASEGLATFVRGLINREALADVLKLGKEQKVVLAQSVGYPK